MKDGGKEHLPTKTLRGETEVVKCYVILAIPQQERALKTGRYEQFLYSLEERRLALSTYGTPVSLDVSRHIYLEEVLPMTLLCTSIPPFRDWCSKEPMRLTQQSGLFR